jgi:hypothetical protein
MTERTRRPKASSPKNPFKDAAGLNFQKLKTQALCRSAAKMSILFLDL